MGSQNQRCPNYDGVSFFCGGLSLSVLTGNKVLAMLAPAGGSALILGWLTLTVFALAKS